MHDAGEMMMTLQQKKELINASPNRPNTIIFSTASGKVDSDSIIDNVNEFSDFSTQNVEIVVINLQLFRCVCPSAPAPVSVATSYNCRFVQNFSRARESQTNECMRMTAEINKTKRVEIAEQWCWHRSCMYRIHPSPPFFEAALA